MAPRRRSPPYTHRSFSHDNRMSPSIGVAFQAPPIPETTMDSTTKETAMVSLSETRDRPITVISLGFPVKGHDRRGFGNAAFGDDRNRRRHLSRTRQKRGRRLARPYFDHGLGGWHRGLGPDRRRPRLVVETKHDGSHSVACESGPYRSTRRVTRDRRSWPRVKALEAGRAS